MSRCKLLPWKFMSLHPPTLRLRLLIMWIKRLTLMTWWAWRFILDWGNMPLWSMHHRCGPKLWIPHSHHGNEGFCSYRNMSLHQWRCNPKSYDPFTWPWKKSPTLGIRAPPPPPPPMSVLELWLRPLTRLKQQQSWLQIRFWRYRWV